MYIYGAVHVAVILWSGGCGVVYCAMCDSGGVGWLSRPRVVVVQCWWEGYGIILQLTPIHLHTPPITTSRSVIPSNTTSTFFQQPTPTTPYSCTTVHTTYTTITFRELCRVVGLGRCCRSLLGCRMHVYDGGGGASGDAGWRCRVHVVDTSVYVV